MFKICYLIFSIAMKSCEKPKAHNELIHTDKFWVCVHSLISLIPLCQTSRIHHWGTLLHWVTCSFIDMNAHTVVYFVSITHTTSCCCWWSPQKYNIYSCLSSIWSKKRHCLAVLGNNLNNLFFKSVFENYICSWTRGWTERLRKLESFWFFST